MELFYWEDLSLEELAVALEIPKGTVKSRLHRGRPREEEPDPGAADS
ncbi:MAG: sigma factor-like helix-turn-helix DNA-binding protein [Pseudomonadota bacterium]